MEGIVKHGAYFCQVNNLLEIYFMNGMRELGGFTGGGGLDKKWGKTANGGPLSQKRGNVPSVPAFPPAFSGLVWGMLDKFHAATDNPIELTSQADIARMLWRGHLDAA